MLPVQSRENVLCTPVFPVCALVPFVRLEKTTHLCCRTVGTTIKLGFVLYSKSAAMVVFSYQILNTAVWIKHFGHVKNLLVTRHGPVELPFQPVFESAPAVRPFLKKNILAVQKPLISRCQNMYTYFKKGKNCIKLTVIQLISEK